MKFEIKEVSESKRKIEVEIPKERVAEEMNNVLKEIRGSIKLDGFRPGKIPNSVLTMRFGKEIKDQIAEKLIEETLPKLISDSGFEVASKPELGDYTVKESQAFKYNVSFDIIVFQDVKDYKNIVVEKLKVKISDDDIQESLDRIRQSQGTMEVVNDRNALDKDEIHGQLTMNIDGNNVPGWTNRKMDLVIGDDKIFPGSDFEKKLIGAAAGSEYQYDVNFPDDYSYYSDFAGKDVVVKWDITEIKVKNIPDVNDELAKDLGLDDLTQLKKQLNEDLLQQKQKQGDEQVQNTTIDILLENNPFTATEFMIQKELNFMMDHSQFKGQLNEEQMKSIFGSIAERNVKQRIIMDKIAKKEQFEASDDEVEEKFKEAVSESDKDETELRKKWYDDGIFDLVREDIVRNKAFDFVIEHSEIKEVDSLSKEKIKKTNNSEEEEKKNDE